MKYRAALMEISEVHLIALRVVREQPTSTNQVQAARDRVLIICQETADVVKALLHPVFEKKRGFCKVRRYELDEETLRGLSIQVTKGSPSHAAPTRR